jgi:hypothetical protein
MAIALFRPGLPASARSDGGVSGIDCADSDLAQRTVGIDTRVGELDLVTDQCREPAVGAIATGRSASAGITERAPLPRFAQFLCLICAAA